MRKIELPPRPPKKAFQIDPLMRQTFDDVDDGTNDTVDAGDFWKYRNPHFLARVIKPLALVVLVAIPFSHERTADALPSAPAAPARVSAEVTTVVQTCLQRFGYSVHVDGVYGTETTKAVRHWQKVNGLAVDGIAGTETLNAIGSTGCGVFVAPSKGQSPVTPREGSSARSAHPAPSGGWHDLAIQVGWSEDQWGTLSCIIQRESNGRPDVQNRSGATGLLQIMKRYYPNDNLFDPATNLRVGLGLYQSRGWSPWNAPRGVKRCF